MAIKKKKQQATIKDIAKLCGISSAAASAAFRNSQGTVEFSEATRARVLEAARLLNYRPNRLARAMRTGAIPVVAVALEAKRYVLEILGVYLHDMPTAAGFRLHELGYEMLFLPYSNHADEVVRLEKLFAERLVGGVVSNIIQGTEDVLVKFLRQTDVPFVLLGSQLPESVVSVDRDDRLIIEELHRYAASVGLRRVLQVTGMGADGKPIFSEYDRTTKTCRHVDGDEHLHDATTLLAVPGAAGVQLMVRDKGIPRERVIIMEDVRLWRGDRPVLLIRSIIPRVAATAVDLVVEWMKTGRRPTAGRHMVEVKAEDLKLLV